MSRVIADIISLAGESKRVGPFKIILSYDWVKMDISTDAVKIGGYTYFTLEHDNGTKIALSTSDLYLKDGDVYVAGEGSLPDNVTVMAGIISPPDSRQTGKGSRAFRDFLKLIDEMQVKITIECQMIGSPKEKKAMGKLPAPKRLKNPELRAWYTRHGFSVIFFPLMQRNPSPKKTPKQIAKSIVSQMPHHKPGSAVYHTTGGQVLDVDLRDDVIFIKTDRFYFQPLDTILNLKNHLGKLI